MAKNYRLKAGTGVFTLTGQDVRMIHTVTKKAVEKSWVLLSAYVVVTVAGIILSYWATAFWSIALSAAVAAVTFVVGWSMIRTVITITNNIR